MHKVYVSNIFLGPPFLNTSVKGHSLGVASGLRWQPHGGLKVITGGWEEWAEEAQSATTPAFWPRQRTDRFSKTTTAETSVPRPGFVISIPSCQTATRQCVEESGVHEPTKPSAPTIHNTTVDWLVGEWRIIVILSSFWVRGNFQLRQGKWNKSNQMKTNTPVYYSSFRYWL